MRELATTFYHPKKHSNHHVGRETRETPRLRPPMLPHLVPERHLGLPPAPRALMPMPLPSGPMVVPPLLPRVVLPVMPPGPALSNVPNVPNVPAFSKSAHGLKLHAPQDVDMQIPPALVGTLGMFGGRLMNFSKLDKRLCGFLAKAWHLQLAISFFLSIGWYLSCFCFESGEWWQDEGPRNYPFL